MISNKQVTSAKIPQLSNTEENFVGGKLRFYLDFWKTLTSDETILGYVKGVSVPMDIDLNELPPIQRELNFSKKEKIEARKKIQEFSEKKIIREVHLDSGPSVV